MDPKTYKNTWSATSNGTYWAGARLLARLDYEKEVAKKAAKLTGKRKSTTTTTTVETGVVTTSTKKAKTGKESKEEAEELIQRINAVVMLNTNAVYDTCPEVVAKIKAFLLRDGVTKAMLCTALGNINNNSMGRFLSGKKQDQCGNITYQSAYIFFEKLRILEGKAKSKARLKNEVANPNGVSAMYIILPHDFNFLRHILSPYITLRFVKLPKLLQFSLVKERAGKYYLVWNGRM
jgi:hypothetical protein